MWNYNLKKGAIWVLKSLNSYEEQYEGMTFGESFVLILSAYTDDKDIEKITFLRLDKKIKNDFYNYYELNTTQGILYVNLNTIHTRR